MCRIASLMLMSFSLEISFAFSWTVSGMDTETVTSIPIVRSYLKFAVVVTDNYLVLACVALAMTDRLTETQVTGWLDGHGLLDAARESGVYAVRLQAPSDDYGRVESRWLAHFDANPPAGLVSRLTDAERFVYVGYANKSIYERLCSHANGDQSASIMAAWPPVVVAGVWPGDGEDGEFNRAQALADDETAVWSDGEFY